jgi:hypothetical protein
LVNGGKKGGNGPESFLIGKFAETVGLPFGIKRFYPGWGVQNLVFHPGLARSDMPP